MKAASFLITSGFLMVILASSVQAGDPTCKEAVNELTKKQLKGVQECTKQMKFKNAKEKAKKMTCVMKCVFMKEDLLGKDGLADPVAALQFVEVAFPRSVQPWVRQLLIGCLDAAAMVDPEEETCKSYDPMIKCAMTALTQFCDPK